MPLNTTTLIAAAQSGCIRSQGELLERFRKYLKTIARAQLQGPMGRRGDPSDVVQEAFLKAHEVFQSFRGGSEAELCAWLRTILASRMAKFVRFQRSKKRNVELERALDLELTNSALKLGQVLMDAGPTPSEHVSQRERALLVADAIEDLPPDYRTVILLRHIQGLPFADVAEHMGRTVHSVKKLHVRGLAQLQRSVEKEQ